MYDDQRAALQAAAIVADTIANHLLPQPCIGDRQKWLNLATNAFNAIEELRTDIDNEFSSVNDLKKIITEKSLIKGRFTLASGTMSTVFFDLKPVMLDPKGANLIADMVLQLITTLPLPRIDAIGGLALGSIPLASVVCAKSYGDVDPISAFYVRKEVKDHGTERLIDGVDVGGLVVALIEDVSTTGTSMLTAANAIRSHGGTVEHAITIIDRLEGAMENLAARDITLHAIFTRDDFN